MQSNAHNAECLKTLRAFRESKRGLSACGVASARKYECGNIQNYGERTNPMIGDRIVLGAEIRKRKIGQVAFQQITHPEFEPEHCLHQVIQVSIVNIAAYELGGGWRGSGSLIQQGDVSFTSREHLVHHRQVSE